MSNAEQDVHVPEFTKSLGQEGEQRLSEVSEPRTAPWSPPGEPRDKAQTANQKRRSRAEQPHAMNIMSEGADEVVILPNSPAAPWSGQPGSGGAQRARYLNVATKHQTKQELMTRRPGKGGTADSHKQWGRHADSVDAQALGIQAAGRGWTGNGAKESLDHSSIARPMLLPLTMKSPAHQDPRSNQSFDVTHSMRERRVRASLGAATDSIHRPAPGHRATKSLHSSNAKQQLPYLQRTRHNLLQKLNEHQKVPKRAQKNKSSSPFVDQWASMAFGKGALKNLGESPGGEQRSVPSTSRSRQRASASPRGSLLAAPMLGPIARKPKLADLRDEPAQGSKMGAPIDGHGNLIGGPAQKPGFLTAASKPTQPLRELRARGGASIKDVKNENLYKSLRKHEQKAKYLRQSHQYQTEGRKAARPQGYQPIGEIGNRHHQPCTGKLSINTDHGAAAARNSQNQSIQKSSRNDRLELSSHQAPANLMEQFSAEHANTTPQRAQDLQQQHQQQLINVQQIEKQNSSGQPRSSKHQDLTWFPLNPDFPTAAQMGLDLKELRPPGDRAIRHRSSIVAAQAKSQTQAKPKARKDENSGSKRRKPKNTHSLLKGPGFDQSSGHTGPGGQYTPISDVKQLNPQRQSMTELKADQKQGVFEGLQTEQAISQQQDHLISGTLKGQHSVEVPEHGGSGADLTHLNQNSVSHVGGGFADEQRSGQEYVIPEEEEHEEEAATLDVDADYQQTPKREHKENQNQAHGQQQLWSTPRSPPGQVVSQGQSAQPATPTAGRMQSKQESLSQSPSRVLQQSISSFRQGSTGKKMTKPGCGHSSSERTEAFRQKSLERQESIRLAREAKGAQPDACTKCERKKQREVVKQDSDSKERKASMQLTLQNSLRSEKSLSQSRSGRQPVKGNTEASGGKGKPSQQTSTTNRRELPLKQRQQKPGAPQKQLSEQHDGPESRTAGQQVDRRQTQQPPKRVGFSPEPHETIGGPEPDGAGPGAQKHNVDLQIVDGNTNPNFEDTEKHPQNQASAAREAGSPDVRALNGDSSRGDSERGSRNAEANDNADGNEKLGSKNINTSSQIDDSTQLDLKKTISTDQAIEARLQKDKSQDQTPDLQSHNTFKGYKELDQRLPINLSGFQSEQSLRKPEPLSPQGSRLSKDQRHNSRMSKASSRSFKKSETAHEIQEKKVKHVAEEIVKELQQTAEAEKKREEERTKREEEKRRAQAERRRLETERKQREKAEEERLAREKRERLEQEKREVMEQQRLARLAETKKALDEKRRIKAAEQAKIDQAKAEKEQKKREKEEKAQQALSPKAARGSVQGTTQKAEARPAARAKTREGASLQEGVSKTKISKNKSATQNNSNMRNGPVSPTAGNPSASMNVQEAQAREEVNEDANNMSMEEDEEEEYDDEEEEPAEAGRSSNSPDEPREGSQDQSSDLKGLAREEKRAPAGQGRQPGAPQRQATDDRPKVQGTKPVRSQQNLPAPAKKEVKQRVKYTDSKKEINSRQTSQDVQKQRPTKQSREAKQNLSMKSESVEPSYKRTEQTAPLTSYETHQTVLKEGSAKSSGAQLRPAPDGQQNTSSGEVATNSRQVAAKQKPTKQIEKSGGNFDEEVLEKRMPQEKTREKVKQISSKPNHLSSNSIGKKSDNKNQNQKSAKTVSLGSYIQEYEDAGRQSRDPIAVTDEAPLHQEYEEEEDREEEEELMPSNPNASQVTTSKQYSGGQKISQISSSGKVVSQQKKPNYEKSAKSKSSAKPLSTQQQSNTRLKDSVRTSKGGGSTTTQQHPAVQYQSQRESIEEIHDNYEGDGGEVLSNGQQMGYLDEEEQQQPSYHPPSQQPSSHGRKPSYHQPSGGVMSDRRAMSGGGGQEDQSHNSQRKAYQSAYNYSQQKHHAADQDGPEMVERGFSPSRDSLGRGAGQDRAQVRSMSGGAMQDSRPARAGAPAPSQGTRAELRDAGCGSFQVGRTDSVAGSKRDYGSAERPEEVNEIVEEQHTTAGAKRRTRAPAARSKAPNHPTNSINNKSRNGSSFNTHGSGSNSQLRSGGGQRKTNQGEVSHQEQASRYEQPEEPYQGPSEDSASTVPNIQRRAGPRKQEVIIKKQAIRKPPAEREQLVQRRERQQQQQQQQQQQEPQGQHPLDQEDAAPDWAQSGLFDLVTELLNLPPQNRMQATKVIERRFLNPQKVDIFTEEEAGYNASLLRRNTQQQRKRRDQLDVDGESDVLDPHDAVMLDGLYGKAKRTIQLLSDHLFISRCAHEDLLGQASIHEPGGASGHLMSPKMSIILLNEEYRSANVDTVIKLLLRCKILYQAMHEVMRILQLIIQQEGIFSQPTGPLFVCQEKYRNDPSLLLSVSDESAIFKGFAVLQTLSRRICHFFNDHRLFTHFIFNQREHQLAILQYAREMSAFLAEHKPTCTKYLHPTLNISGYLQFRSSAQFHAAARGRDTNAQDADDACLLGEGPGASAGSARAMSHQSSRPMFLGIAEPNIDEEFYRIEFGGRRKDLRLPSIAEPRYRADLPSGLSGMSDIPNKGQPSGPLYAGQERVGGGSRSRAANQDHMRSASSDQHSGIGYGPRSDSQFCKETVADGAVMGNVVAERLEDGSQCVMSPQGSAALAGLQAAEPILSESQEDGDAEGAEDQHPQLDVLSGGTYQDKRGLASMGTKPFEDGQDHGPRRKMAGVLSEATVKTAGRLPAIGGSMDKSLANHAETAQPRTEFEANLQPDGADLSAHQARNTSQSGPDCGILPKQLRSTEGLGSVAGSAAVDAPALPRKIHEEPEQSHGARTSGRADDHLDNALPAIPGRALDETTEHRNQQEAFKDPKSADALSQDTQKVRARHRN